MTANFLLIFDHEKSPHPTHGPSSMFSASPTVAVSSIKINGYVLINGNKV